MQLLAISTVAATINLGRHALKRVAVIGSFRRFYDEVLHVIRSFQSIGLVVTSPAGSALIEPNIPFVRFTTDPSKAPDELVQTLTLRNIFSADAVFVVAPGGYVGRTTCYEIGRIIQRRQPIYFSSIPLDLPVRIPDRHVISAESFAERVLNGSVKPVFDDENDHYSLCEQELVTTKKENE
jgi:hypothetical protein